MADNAKCLGSRSTYHYNVQLLEQAQRPNHGRCMQRTDAFIAPVQSEYAVH